MSQKISKRSRKHADESQQITKNGEQDNNSDVQPSEENAVDVKNGDKVNENGTDNQQHSVEEITPCETTSTGSESLATELSLKPDISNEEENQKEVVEEEKVEKSEKANGQPEKVLEPLVLESQPSGLETVTEREPEKTEEKDENYIECNIKLFIDDEEIEKEPTNDDKCKKIDEKAKNLDDYDRNENEESDENSQETFGNMSTLVIMGDDSTRNVDITVPPDDNFSYSKFLNMSKDHSLGESLKYLSARRSIRSGRGHVVDGTNTYALHESTNDSRSNKRKFQDEPVDGAKRYKKDSSGLLSYFSHPFSKHDVSSRSPKLTNFKLNKFDNTNVSKISLNDTDKSQNKWCSIM